MPIGASIADSVSFREFARDNGMSCLSAHAVSGPASVRDWCDC